MSLTHQIKVGQYKIDVVHKNIKNLHLAVYPPTGRIRIAAPLNVKEESIRLFVISKMRWIKKQVAHFENQERQSEREYITGESHYFEGHRYLLNIIEHDKPPKIVVRNKTYIDFYVRPNSSTEQRKKVMTEWYRKELKAKIPELIEKWENIIGVKINSWQVKKMPRKWGTCNIEKKHILLNLELIKKPPKCLEYIIAHELIHLLERHHNDRYRAYLDEFMPNWRNLRKELNEFVL